MFLINSRLGQFSAATSRIRKTNTITWHPLSRSYGVILPSSLTRVFSRALGFSPFLPVSVYGTVNCNLVRGFSRQLGISKFVTKFHSTSRLRLYERRFFLSLTLNACTHNQQCALPTLLCHPILQTITAGIGILTDCPSPTLHASA